MNRSTTIRSLVSTLSMAGTAAVAGLWLAPSAYADDETEPIADVDGMVTDVQGKCPNLRFKLGKTQVVTKEQTRYEDGACTDIKNNQRVEVTGKLEEDGRLIATEVDLDD